MKLTNQQIYDYATQLANFNLYNPLPVRINFFLNRNIQKINELGKEIEAIRLQIAQTFGELNDEGTQYCVPSDRIPLAQKELNDLFSLEQDIELHLFTLDDFEGIDLTYDQMGAIMFMIKEE